MQILIDGKPAVLKSGTSFEYVSENRLFSGADDYTLAITFPLADCQRNLDIFGHINRKDVATGKVRFDCEIRAADFIKFGTITITEISDVDIKAQFLAGRSEQNFDDTFDDKYINELTLGTPAIKSASQIQPSNAWDPTVQNMESVALPWVNNDSGIIHNCAEYENGVYSWNEETTYLSWQPYLIFITKKICDAVGYQYDFSKWEAKDEYKYLLICNCLPSAWDIQDYARALPHWTVAEYFEKLEIFLEGEFNIDHRARKISFDFTKAVMQDHKAVRLDSVIDSFSAQVKDSQKDCDYLDARNIVFKDCDFTMWKFYSCYRPLKGWKGEYVEYDTLAELISKNKSLRFQTGHHRGQNDSALLYAKDVDMHFIIIAVDKQQNPDTASSSKYQYIRVLQPVNMYGGRIFNEDKDADQTEIEFVPANIDFTESKYGWMLFLQSSGFDEQSQDSDSTWSPGDGIGENIPHTVMQSWFESVGHEDGGVSEYFDRIYIGFWDGAKQEQGLSPHPYVSNIYINHDWSAFSLLHFNFRLNDANSTRFKPLYKIDPSTKMTFKFLADAIPDVRALFYIQGRRYICEKITATFSENGLSQLMKGEFYPVVD